MGLDTVEIVLWAESNFDICISDDEAGAIYTVGEFATLIESRVNENVQGSIDFNNVLSQIITVLEKDYDVPKGTVRTSSRFIEDLLLD